MADDEQDMGNNDDAAAAVINDDYYTLGTNSTDDYYNTGEGSESYNHYNNNHNYNGNFDDEFYSEYYSGKSISGWFNNLLYNSTANLDPTGEGQLTPAEDVNAENVLAAFVFNIMVCVVLMGMYEILRRCIPSVYSQRLVNGGGGGKCSAVEGVELGWGDWGLEQPRRKAETAEDSGASLSPRSTSLAMRSGLKASGSVCVNRNAAGEEAVASTDKKKNDDNAQPRNKSNATTATTNWCTRLKPFPILEWVYPIHKTPWSTIRELAGLDAYFYLRYIRMCFKITAVSSFWALAILCPVYAYGGGGQTGFYHFSMANVLPTDKWRVWVPTFFCWAFTMYCWFCVRLEMVHYVELRMHFLGGEEEERMRGLVGAESSMGWGSERVVVPALVDATTDSDADDSGEETEDNQNNKQSSAPNNDQNDRNQGLSLSPLPENQYLNPLLSSTFDSQAPNSNRNYSPQQQQNHIKQHRYSLQVEKIPLDLRSNTALFAYFNEIFPDQVHSACVAMNVPDLDALSARRLRVTRRLEKSLAYLYATGNRPTHITGRGRIQCLGIESTPIDVKCMVCCCCYDSCMEANYMEEDGEETNTESVYDILPGKGECVDSIAYYTRDLADGNLKMKKLQQEKFEIAETGLSFYRKDGGKVGPNDWFTAPLSWAKNGAQMAAEGLRDEFEVLSEEDVWEQSGICGREDDVLDNCVKRSPGYGSFSSDTKQSANGTPLVEDDRLIDSDERLRDGTAEEDKMPPRRSSTRQRLHRSYLWLRGIAWRMGVDFLADGLDIFRNQTDVVVDSVTRPSMSSTGFVTFKTLTPVTVSTSAPITYNGNPLEVFVAPEPRDIKWQNVQIDRDIGAGREFIANVLLGVGVLLWSIPLTLIQAWSKVEKVAMIPGLEWINDIGGDQWKPLVNGYLPVITLLGLILILPLIFQLVATSYEKRKTISDVEDSIVGRYFYYQLANIYITVTAGALWTSMAEIIDHPSSVLLILGETLPKLAGYFISLLITKTLAGLPMVLLRFGALSRMAFLRSCFNKQRLTQTELNEVYRKQPINYGWEYPTHFLVIIICFTYACITPFILPVGAVFFFCALIVYKKQALYVYTPTYESGGTLFPQAVRKTIFALIISQMTFIGYTLIRKGVYQLLVLAPLPFLTVYFNMYIQNRFVSPSTKLSLERAVKIDAREECHTEFSDEAYQQPVLTEKATIPKSYRRDEKEEDPTLLKVLHDLKRFQEDPERNVV